MSQGLRDVLSEAQANGTAVGHFNVSDVAILNAILNGARDRKTAVIVGVSEGERTYLGTRQIAAMIRSIRDEIDVPIFSTPIIPIRLRAPWRQLKPDLIRLSSTSPRYLLKKT